MYLRNILFLFIVLGFWSCADHHDEGIYEYHAHIKYPLQGTKKKLRDTLNVVIDFESHTGQIVHHINVEIKDSTTSTILFSQPAEKHVHETDGMYRFAQNLTLETASGFTSNSRYILTAKVWGEKDGEEEVVESIEFFIE